MPEGSQPWKGAGLRIFPVLSRFALKFLYICSRLIVDLERGFPTPFKFSFGLSGFIEWLDLLKPCLRGAPDAERTFGMVSVVFGGSASLT